MNEIIKDLPFYEQSGGGVTFSGGEPFYQADFLLEMLERCKNEYIHTAIDTSGYCETKTILKAAEITDCFLYDLKFFDTKKHQKYCGVSNELILKNLKSLSQTKTKLLIRIPIIPSINTDVEEMTGIFNFIKDFDNIKTVHFLPYHNIQSEKYLKMNRLYELSDIINNEITVMPKITNLFASRFLVKKGG
jgi:pyruvate formate lyase activating enzyme